MKRERKDYGCPLRVWHDQVRGLYVILPPRSQRAAERWLHAADAHTPPDWRGYLCNGSGEQVSPHMLPFKPGPDLGQRVTWAEVPEPLRAFLRASEFAEYCPPPPIMLPGVQVSWHTVKAP